jgi:cation transport protein ChaC
MRLLAGRASISAPGRMLGLRPGGQTAGMAFRLSEEDLEEELALVWTREMPTGAYSPLWLPVVLKGGAPQVALVFVSNEEHPFLETDTSIATIAPLMAAASGPIGTNADYVRRLAATIEELGFEDAYVKALADEVDRLRASWVRAPGQARRTLFTRGTGDGSF